MYSKERIDKIIEILKSKKNVSSAYLSQQLFTSISTIRRDILELEKSGMVKRSHGGVTLIQSSNIEHSYMFREMENQNEKNYICNLAIDFISNGYAIFLDSSSTVSNLCPLLKKYSDLTVVTNGVKTALELAQMDSITTFIAGGQLKPGSTSVVGEFTGSFIDNFHADLSIISCRGINEDGAYEANQVQALVKQHMIKNSKSTILLCDSSKFNQSHFYKLSSFKDLTAVITDKQPSSKIINSIIDEGSEILY
ncbi:MAG: DeoR/GlpR transcriptional regulator [Eubacterium sp.]|jgi:DeoR/GlpR family transcriptional regulator of sugar metabolism|nr:DeoR/GlpR transcriptional regulator [Eubacterium sp.]